MKTLYDPDVKYLEVFDSRRDFTGTPIDNDLTIFYDDKDQAIVGFSLEGAPKNIKKLSDLPARFKLAGLTFLIRKLENLTQEELGEKASLGRRTVQRLESGEANISYDNLLRIVETFPKYDYSVLLKPQKGQKSAS